MKVPETAREMVMVMIPKPGRDHQRFKGWRAIVSANVVGKLREKLIAEDLQEVGELWHERACAGRKGRGAMDSVMLIDQLRRGYPSSDVHGRDIHSAFNSIHSKIMCSLITDEDLRSWARKFMKPRSFQIKTGRRNDYDSRHATRVTAEPEPIHNLHVSHGKERRRVGREDIEGKKGEI